MIVSRRKNIKVVRLSVNAATIGKLPKKLLKMSAEDVMSILQELIATVNGIEELVSEASRDASETARLWPND